MEGLKGIHIQSTAPFKGRLREGDRPSCLEISSMALSALLWRKHCGQIKLYTDELFSAFLLKNGFDGLWDGGIDTRVVESISGSVDETVFWSASKLFALRDSAAPVAMVDHDLFFWKDVRPYLGTDEEVTVLHREYLWDCYVPKNKLGRPPGYRFNRRWDWKELPCNTAFAFFPDNGFKDMYVDEAVRFMTDNPGKDVTPSSQMVFCEQRIIAMCAKLNGVPVKTLIDNPFDDSNDLFTHLWGAKARAGRYRVDMKRIVSAILTHLKGLDEDYYQRIRELYPDS